MELPDSSLKLHTSLLTLVLYNLQETAQLLSERLSGVPKSLEHREAISVAQRRRLMVTGILRAVESVHSAEEASTSYATKPASRFALCAGILAMFCPCAHCCLLLACQHAA
jgi:hypothetical protein